MDNSDMDKFDTNKFDMTKKKCSLCGETDHNGLAQGLFKAKTAWFVTLTPFECVRADQKDFETVAANGESYKWGWATVEVNEPTKLLSVM